MENGEWLIGYTNKKKERKKATDKEEKRGGARRSKRNRSELERVKEREVPDHTSFSYFISYWDVRFLFLAASASASVSVSASSSAFAAACLFFLSHFTIFFLSFSLNHCLGTRKAQSITFLQRWKRGFPSSINLSLPLTLSIFVKALSPHT